MKIGRYLIVFVFLMSMLITFGKRGIVDNYAMKERLMALKKANSDIALENRELSKKAALLRSDLQYIEMVARNEIGMVRKGDLVYRYSK
ncbi:MAG: septum formation initiator family protein [Syntrophaceae bacterium]|jgi:cell division protein FtsB|nr:septum formation initiator family protein [Syntrophaceae bacterium]